MSEHAALIQEQMNRLTASMGALTERNAALVALCEKMLYDLETEMPPHRAFDLDEYRARLAQLRGA